MAWINQWGPIIEAIPKVEGVRRFRINLRIERSYTPTELRREVERMKCVVRAYEAKFWLRT